MEPITVSVEQAAEQLLGVSKSHAYRMIKNGELPGAYRAGGRWLVNVQALRAGSAASAQDAAVAIKTSAAEQAS
jgi:excisionase family DNA binding protein